MQLWIKNDYQTSLPCVIAIDMISAGDAENIENGKHIGTNKIPISGVDTTGNSLAFLVYNLAVNQRVQIKLRQEIQEKLPDNTTKGSEVEKLTYLKACIKENFRRYPISHTNLRVTGED